MLFKVCIKVVVEVLITSFFSFVSFSLKFSNISLIGFLFVSYEWGNRVGSIAMPWGLGTLGVSPSFGTESELETRKFVATELRQVTINGVAYQIKVSTWSLSN